MFRCLVVLLALFFPSLDTPTLDFDPPVYYGVGSIPQRLSSADYNGDGHPDLAVLNWQAGNISVLLGDGQGNLILSSVVPAGTNVMALDSGKVDEGGHVDLLVVDADSHALRVLWGDGEGGFTPGPELLLPNRPRAVANADFDGDGHLDLAVGVEGPGFLEDGKVIIYHGTGDGQFTWVEEHEVWSFSIQLSLVDMNSDGWLDLLSANPSFGGPVGGLTLFLGDGAGGFTLGFQALDVTESLAVADFDEDGRLDVAATLAEDFVCAPEYRVYFGDGEGGFSSSVTHEVGCFTDFVVTSDFDVDGHSDLAFTDLTTDRVYVVAGDGAGGFAPPLEVAIATIPWAPAVEDFDGDGDADLALLAVGSDSIAVLLNQTHPRFIRGDCDAGGSVDLGDAIFLLGYLFTGGAVPPCTDACDTNDGGAIDLTDAVYLLDILFSGIPPFPPFPDCGIDPTPDGLGCDPPLACP